MGNILFNCPSILPLGILCSIQHLLLSAGQILQSTNLTLLIYIKVSYIIVSPTLTPGFMIVNNAMPVHSLLLLSMEYLLGLQSPGRVFKLTQYIHISICLFSEPLILSSTLFQVSFGISTLICVGHHIFQGYKRQPSSSVLEPIPIIKTLNPIL